MSLGLDPADYWNYTPAEGALIVAGQLERIRLRHNADARLAHLTASLFKVKDLRRVPLERLTLKSLGPKRRQTKEEMIAVMRSIVAAMNAPKQRTR